MSYFTNAKKLIKVANGITQKKKHIRELKTINYLYLNGPKTINDICKTLKISTPNSVNIINELTAANIIEKKGLGPSIGGRKPDLYALKQETFYVIAIEMGRYTTRIAIYCNENKNITGVNEFSLSIKNTEQEEACELLYKYTRKVIESSGLDETKILGVGLVMPGLVDSRKGINYTNLVNKGSSLKKVLESKFGFPVFVENIAKSIALAEYRFGLARNKKNVLVISLNWGIGLGLILDGKLHRGSTGFSGEFSHIPMVENGDVCPCGKTGCLETIASGFTLVKLAKKGIEEDKSILLKTLTQGDPGALTPGLVLDAALKGDQYSLNILSEIGTNLGKGIAILIQLFNPELIILGGIISNAKQYITTPIQHALNIYSMQQISKKTTIELSELGNDIGILGAVAVAMENLFNHIIEQVKI